MVKSKTITIQGNNIALVSHKDEDYVSLTDLCKGFEGDTGLIEKWLSNKNTLEYLVVWESLYNPDFNSPEIGGIMMDAGSNKFYMSVKKWVATTNSVGIIAKAGRYGGTYAHKDIALKFGAYLSPVFELYINREFQRLKEAEENTLNLEWNVKRFLTKVNYSLHTAAIKDHIVPKSKLPKDKVWVEYAEEADLLNVALFGCTAKDWKEVNPEHALNKKNMRDFSSINELVVMANLESLNAEMTKLGTPREQRFKLMKATAKDQLSKLKENSLIKAIRKQDERTYIEAQKKTGEELKALSEKSILEQNQENLSKFNKNLKKGLGFNPNDPKNKK